MGADKQREVSAGERVEKQEIESTQIKAWITEEIIRWYVESPESSRWWTYIKIEKK